MKGFALGLALKQRQFGNGSRKDSLTGNIGCAWQPFWVAAMLDGSYVGLQEQ